MIEKKTWEEFRTNGLLWFINSILHMFGWAICYEKDDKTGLFNVFPARVKFRGFPEETNRNGYIKVSEYLKENISDLVVEAKE